MKQQQALTDIWSKDDILLPSFIYGISLQEELRREKDQVKVYLDYLTKLKEVCNELSIVFEDSDRVLYELDKKYNKHIKLKVLVCLLR